MSEPTGVYPPYIPRRSILTKSQYITRNLGYYRAAYPSFWDGLQMWLVPMPDGTVHDLSINRHPCIINNAPQPITGSDDPRLPYPVMLHSGIIVNYFIIKNTRQTLSFIQNTLTLTIDMWIRLTSFDRQILLGNMKAYGQNGFLIMWETGVQYGQNAIRFSVAQATPDEPVIEINSPPNASITDLLWHHVLIRGWGSNGIIDFFFDGVKYPTTYETAFAGFASGDSDLDLYFGTTFDVSASVVWSSYFGGIRFYNRPFTDQEIQLSARFPFLALQREYNPFIPYTSIDNLSAPAGGAYPIPLQRRSLHVL